MKKPSGAKEVGRPRGKNPPVDVDESAVMTLQDLADYPHCHMTTVYRLLKETKIPGFKLGGEWRFLKSEVDTWIAAGGGRPAPTVRGRRRRKR